MNDQTQTPRTTKRAPRPGRCQLGSKECSQRPCFRPDREIRERGRKPEAGPLLLEKGNCPRGPHPPTCAVLGAAPALAGPARSVLEGDFQTVLRTHRGGEAEQQVLHSPPTRRRAVFQSRHLCKLTLAAKTSEFKNNLKIPVEEHPCLEGS